MIVDLMLKLDPSRPINWTRIGFSVDFGRESV